MAPVERNVWVISEVFSPDETATAHYMTGIAEALAKQFRVRVLSVQPTYTLRGTVAPTREIRNGVDIRRCRSSTFDKNNLFLRSINIVTIALSLAFASLRLIRRRDLVLVVTNPPILPLLVQLACIIKGARCVVRVDDVYSEMMVASGMLRRQSLRYRLINGCTRWVYGRAEGVIVLGRDMKELVCQSGCNTEKATVIPNWSDCDEVKPSARQDNPLLQQLGLSGKFVVECAGNLGRVQAVETLLQAAVRLRDAEHIHFLFVGNGAKRGWIEAQKRTQGLRNITLLNSLPRADQNVFLNACDIGTTALVEGMLGAAVPSRLYNILAAGRPVLVIGDEQSEGARVVQEEKVGWVASPTCPDKVASIIFDASKHPDLLQDMGHRARAASEAKYSRPRILQSYLDLTRQLMSLEPSHAFANPRLTSPVN